MNKKERNLASKGYKFTGMSVTDYTEAKELAKQARREGFFASIVPHTCLGRIYNTVYYRIYIKENHE